MKAVVVDDESLLLEQFRYECEGISEIEQLECFDSPLDAIDFARTERFDIAFIDLAMPEMNGAALAERLHELQPEAMLIAVTAFDRAKAGESKGAFKDVLLKPVSAENILTYLNILLRERGKA